jgi:hypothetical protein
MKTYLLFIFGVFEDQQDIEYFCMEILASSPMVKSVRYVIENSKNIIVIFDSDKEHKELSKELYSLLINDSVKFYFLFTRDNLVSAHLPMQIKDFIFKPLTDLIGIKYNTSDEDSPQMDLDEVLEKIEKMGIESLTPEEKNFLDNFEI